MGFSGHTIDPTGASSVASRLINAFLMLIINKNKMVVKGIYSLNAVKLRVLTDQAKVFSLDFHPLLIYSLNY